ncbi:hypothetical protein [Streptomyces sp. NPDC002588]|uniref:hypothetical protein n=1 Tax=Streptomyces sp. NPDC002588 TaxID=3154419 RepID=UPI00331F857C
MLGRTEALRSSTRVGAHTVIQCDGPRLGALVGESQAAAVRVLDPDALPGALLIPSSGIVAGIASDAGQDEVVRVVEKLLATGTERIVVAAADGDRPAREITCAGCTRSAVAAARDRAARPERTGDRQGAFLRCPRMVRHPGN